jgi:cell division protein FtsW (lipid II flippase)
MSRVWRNGAGRRRAERPVRETARTREPGLDGGVLTAALLLCGLGAVMIFSITAPRMSPADAAALLPAPGRGARRGAPGRPAAALPLRVWHALALPLWVPPCALIAVLAFGIETNGARRWLGVDRRGS